MEKIRIIQNAATFVSDLTVEEIKVLQRQDPMALAIKEPNTDGGEDIVFLVDYKETAYGKITDSHIVFVDKTTEDKACLTVLIPANEKDKATYLYDTYAVAVNMLKTVERNAKNALKNLTTSKEAFAKEFINLDSASECETATVAIEIEPTEKTNKE